jgi:hypothetical protein
MHRTKLSSAALIVALAACSGAGSVAPGAGPAIPSLSMRLPAVVLRPAITAPRHWTVKVFARGNAKRYNPDPIVKQGRFFYVSFQNATMPDGTGGKSTIVQFKSDGSIAQQIKVPGRCDGMRWDPYTNLMWITVNEDANSSMFTWDPASGAIKHYSFSSAKHGGGYDDLAFANGKSFIAASNPTLSPKGINKGPALVSVVLKGSTAEVTPVLMGDGKAKDIVTGKTVQLNLTDPDSMTVAPNGDVLLVSQADSEIVFLHDAGKSSQSVSRLLVGTQLDDTVYATQRHGFLYVVDQKKNAIYALAGRLQPGTLYTEAPSDSYVAAFVGTVDASTGTITPIVTHFGSPTGLIFVPGSRE